jgi:hypothetical protein
VRELRYQLQAKLRELCDLDGGASSSVASSSGLAGASVRSSQESDGSTRHAIRGFVFLCHERIVREFHISGLGLGLGFRV